MNVLAVEQLLTAFVERHRATFSELSKRQSQLLELGAMVAFQEHYRSNDWSVQVRNPGGGSIFKVKRNTRGHPAQYSRIVVSKERDLVELHMNTAVRSARDAGIYCVDVALVEHGAIPDAPRRGERWVCVENESLRSFAEVKRLVVYPMLLAQFIGIVHELKPSFLTPPHPSGFGRASTPPPTLIVLGSFSGNSALVVGAYPSRGILVKISETFDLRVAAHRAGQSASPLYWNNE